jgi:competence protein ComEC
MHPLILPAAAMILGVLGGSWLLPPAWAMFALAGALGICLLFYGVRYARLPIWLISLCCLFLGAGLFMHSQPGPLPTTHIKHLAKNRPTELSGMVVKAPEPKGHRRLITLSASNYGGQTTNGLLQLSLHEAIPPPRVGDNIRVRARLRPFSSFANPGGFDYAAFMASKRLWAQGFLGSRTKIEHTGQGDLPYLKQLVESKREYLGELLDRLEPCPARGLLRALILGQRGELPGGVKDAFAATGTAHLLAISGLHMALVWGAMFLLLRLGLAAIPGLALRLPVLKLASMLALVPCLAYAALAGLSTPTLRALIMAATLSAALWLGRPYRSSGALALSALLIMGLWPTSPFQVSFLLSFTAVASILLIAVPLTKNLWKRTYKIKPLAFLLASWLVSAVVGLTLLPLTLHTFHQLPWLLLPANMIAVPLLSLTILPIALLGSFCALFAPGLGLAILGLAQLTGGWLLDYIGYLASFDWAVSFMAGPKPHTLILFYAALLAWVLFWGRLRIFVGGILSAAALAAWLIGAMPPPADGRLTVWVLDVGDGSATVARVPDGRVLVVDGGGWPGSGFDFGKSVVGPFLWSQGLSRIDLIISSHSESKRSGGLAFVARWFNPALIWTNGDKPKRGFYAKLYEVAQGRNIPLKSHTGLKRRHNLGLASLHLAWPPIGGAPPNLKYASDRSIWLGLKAGQTGIWLPSGNGPYVEHRVADRLPRWDQAVLIAPRNGAKASCTKHLLHRVRPGVVVFPCACYGFRRSPHPGSLARVIGFGAKHYSTAEFGCIKLVSDGKSWEITPHLKTKRPCP